MKTLLLLLVSFSATCQDTLLIYFDYDQWHMKPEIEQSFFESLKPFDDKSVDRIEVIGHTDSDGSLSYNQALGRKRASHIKQVLQKRFSISKIEISSKGETDSIVGNISDADKALNRRVELIVHTITIADTAQLVSKENLTVGYKVVLENLNFYGGEAIIVPSSKPVLLKLLQMLKEHPTLEIRLEGHICCSPPGEDGMDFSTGIFNLSEARAKAVYQFLVDNGIDSSRLTYKGLKGDFRLVKIERTEMDRLKNRRVEMVVTHY